MYSVGDKVKINPFWRKSTTETDNFSIDEDRHIVMTIEKIITRFGLVIYYTDFWIVPEYMLIPERSLSNVIRNRRYSVT